MAERSEGDGDWPRFVGAVAELAELETAAIRPEARLVEDLGLDSVAIAELVTLLIDEYGAEALATALEEQGWSGMTVEELYNRFAKGDPGRPRLVVKRQYR
jgi:acyl carrier protein